MRGSFETNRMSVPPKDPCDGFRNDPRDGSRKEASGQIGEGIEVRWRYDGID